MATIIRKGPMHNPPHPGAILRDLYMKPSVGGEPEEAALREAAAPGGLISPSQALLGCG
jgi:hypothetical protein